MKLTETSLRHPYGVAALALLIVAVGLVGLFRNPADLFPETFPPQVLIITEQPGASADDISDKITEIIEKEINTVGGLENIRSTSRDQVSAVSVEFKYSKDPGQAILDVRNALARIQADLPEGALEPKLYRLSEATTRPLLTLALTPRDESRRTLSEIRLLAENRIQDQLLRLEGVADVDVFGAHRPEVRVRIDREKLAAHDLSLGEVIGALGRQNVSAPAGNIYTGESEYLVRIAGEFKDLQAIEDFTLRRPEAGLLRVGDIADVELAEREPRSLYHGNGAEAIALGMLKPEGGDTVAAIKRIKEFLPELRAEYPDIAFDITQDQQPLIDINMKGMVFSIIQAVLLTMLVIFLFLAEARAALIVGISIPLSFLFSFGVLWLTPYSLNMVTLSGLIVATGMVVDASVVTLENIYRHFRERKTADGETTALEGTREITLAITAGMLTTVAVLVPIIFIGEYPGRTIGRLSFVISVTMIMSLIVALSLIPLLTSKVLNRRQNKRNIFERAVRHVDRLVKQVRRFYVGVLKLALRHRMKTLVLAATFFVFSVKTIPPIIGGALMPPMDTGIAVIEFDLPATDDLEQVQTTLRRVEEIIYQQPGIEQVSSVVGSEPGSVGFGVGGATAQSVVCTVEMVDRTRRERTIWDIIADWREGLRAVPGIKSFRISEYGATPMATTKAPLNFIISGPDPRILDRLAEEILDRLKKVRGLTDIRHSWHFDEKQVDVRVDPALASLYGTSPAAVASELKAAVQGVPATPMRLADFLDIPIRVQYEASERDSVAALEQTYVGSALGPVPLRALADTEVVRQRPFITRENLRPTIDITGVNRGMTIAQVTNRAKKAIADIKMPRRYDIESAGSMTDMKETQKQLRETLLIGIVLLYLLLVIMFHSFVHPLTVMAAIPLAVAGSLWGLLLFDKPMCMPANMGMIFLAGIVINNSVLLLDFIVKSRKHGMDKDEAIIESVKLRLRPIFMTTFSTIFGISPLIFEMAVGLERLSPLGIVAGSGLLIGTFLTLIVLPVVDSSLDSLSSVVSGWVKRALPARELQPDIK